MLSAATLLYMVPFLEMKLDYDSIILYILNEKIILGFILLIFTLCNWAPFFAYQPVYPKEFSVQIPTLLTACVTVFLTMRGERNKYYVYLSFYAILPFIVINFAHGLLWFANYFLKIDEQTANSFRLLSKHFLPIEYGFSAVFIIAVLIRTFFRKPASS